MRLRSSLRALPSLTAILLLASCGAFGFRQPEVELESVQLAYYNGYTYREVAELLDDQGLIPQRNGALARSPL